jgi:hypothetical protein
MEKISSKQITGVVDLNSNQSITGRKDFQGGLTSSGGPTGHIPLMQDGYLYFVRDPNQVADGDFRFGVSSLSGLFCLQQLSSGMWTNICLDGCASSTTSGGTGGGTGGGDLGGGGGCLLYGTLITLADGTTKLIEDLELGDLVKTVSIDGLDSEVEDAWKTFTSSSFSSMPASSTVTGIQKAQFSYYFLINNLLKITFEHPVLVQRAGSFQFLRAKDLLVGDKFYRTDETWVDIDSIERIDENVNVVNINVESQDTYFADGVLVHNLVNPYEEKVIV